MPKVDHIKVMIVDDHPVVRTGLKTMFFAFEDIDFVSEASSGKEALGICEDVQPDVILMDIKMPEMDGLETTRAITEKFPAVKVIILTSFAEGNMVQDALNAGAVGYLLKNAPIDDYAAAIRAAQNGQPTLAPEATRALIKTKTTDSRIEYGLSTRELQVLALIVKGKSNEEIAAELTISEATARHHVSACISKLGVDNRTQAAVLAIEQGLI